MSNQNTNKTHCKRGHEFTLENTYVEPATLKRQCRVCSITRSRVNEKNRNRTPENRHLYRVENLDRFLELEHKQRTQNPEKQLEKTNKWRLKNMGKVLEYNKQWRAKNPEKMAAARHKRRALEGNFTAQQWKDLKDQYGNKCLGCGRAEEELVLLGLKLTPDHVLPIALGGSGDISNIQPLCFGKGGCNNRKSIKHIDFRNTNLKVMPSASEQEQLHVAIR